MEQKLKMSTGRAVVGMVLVVVLLALGVLSLYYGLSDIYTPWGTIDTYNLFSAIIVITAVVLAVTALVTSVYNSTVRPLTFNNINFTFKGKTYTYQQIEKIKLIGGRFGSVSYMIYIDGKKLYTFDDEYEGAKEFMYYLDFYKVPGTPRA